jgi:hypothetical protein
MSLCAQLAGVESSTKAVAIASTHPMPFITRESRANEEDGGSAVPEKPGSYPDTAMSR